MFPICLRRCSLDSEKNDLGTYAPNHWDRTLGRLADWMTDPDGIDTLRSLVENYPAEILASQVHYPSLYLEK